MEPAPREIIILTDHVSMIDMTKPNQFGFSLSQLPITFWFSTENRPSLELFDRVRITITKEPTTDD